MPIESRNLGALACLVLAASSGLPEEGGPYDNVRFLRFEDVQEVVGSFKDPAAWDSWIGAEDQDIRGRVDRGVEDSISNLVLYGTSYTRLPRVQALDQAASINGELLEPSLARVRALALAMQRPQSSERVLYARDFLTRRGLEAGSAPAVEAFLAANLKRFVGEQRDYERQLQKVAGSADPGEVFLTRGILFSQRGLSVDTSLLPDLALEDTLRALASKGVLAPGRIRRIAVIGPGLDFADKRNGYDFYPLQTIQPFAVLEAVARLGLARLDTLSVATFDVNPLVNAHIQRLAARGRGGHAYVIQLPRDPSAGWSAEAVSYWKHFGDVIGREVAPQPVPLGLGAIVARAISVTPNYAAELRAVDLDIVTQTLDSRSGDGFDLVIATNVLLYYDLFHQALAMASVARMMAPGGIFLANHALPAQHPAALEYVGRRSVTYSLTGAYGDDVVVYRRR